MPACVVFLIRHFLDLDLELELELRTLPEAFALFSILLLDC